MKNTINVILTTIIIMKKITKLMILMIYNSGLDYKTGVIGRIMFRKVYFVSLLLFF